MSKKIISFDVGIKNLAYCYLEEKDQEESSKKSYKILDWKILNLMEDGSSENSEDLSCRNTCTCYLAKKNTTITCGKRAKYFHGDTAAATTTTYYCEVHAKKKVAESTMLIPTKQHERSWLNKQSKEQLTTIYRFLGVSTPPPSTKKDLIDFLVKYYQEKSLKKIVNSKTKNAKEMDLVTIGRNMANHLDKFKIQFGETSPPTHVIIENQISTIATRMKTIQGELTMYFLVHFPNAHIEYISSKNKLKGFQKSVQDLDLDSPVENIEIKVNTKKDKPKKGDTYRNHKADAIEYTKQILEESDSTWTSFFMNEKKKRDDLADCFLQGLWYLDNK